MLSRVRANFSYMLLVVCSYMFLTNPCDDDFYFVSFFTFVIADCYQAKKIKNNTDGEQLKRYTVKWTEHIDVVLLNALLEQQIIGNRIDGTFTTTAYNNVLKIVTITSL